MENAMENICMEVYLNGDYRVQFGSDGEKSPVTLNNCTARRFAMAQLKMPNFTLVESIELEMSDVFLPNGVRNLCITDQHGRDLLHANSNYKGEYEIYHVDARLFPDDLLWEKNAVKNCTFKMLPPALQKLIYNYTANSEVHESLIRELVRGEISAFREMNRFGAPKIESPAFMALPSKAELAHHSLHLAHSAH